jgi:predicted ATPase
MLFRWIQLGSWSIVDTELLLNIEFLQKHKGVADPLEVVAGEISDEAILLCLDEFMVC